MRTNSIRKSALGIIVAMLLAFAACFTTMSAISARAEEGYDSNGYTVKAGGGWNYGVAATPAPTVEDDLSKFSSVMNSSIHNANKIVLGDSTNPGVNIHYKFDFSTRNHDAGANELVRFVLVTPAKYEEKKTAVLNPDDFDSSKGVPFGLNIGASAVSTIGGKGFASSVEEWSGLKTSKFYDINIYIGTGEGEDKSYVIINNKKVETSATLSQFADGEGGYAAYLTMLPKDSGIGMQISRPTLCAKPQLSSYAITGVSERVKMSAGDEQTIAYTPNADLVAAEPTYTWESSNHTVATVDATGKVTAHAQGTAVISLTATTGSAADGDLEELAAASCTVYAFEYHNETGWMTGVGAGWATAGIIAESFDYSETDKTATFIVASDTETWNNKPLNVKDNLVHLSFVVAENAGGNMLFNLIPKSKYDINLSGSDAYRVDNQRKTPFGLYVGNDAIKFESDGTGINGYEDVVKGESDTLNIAAGEKVNVTIHVGTGEENDKSYIVVNGNKRISNATLADFGNETDGYIGYVHLFSQGASTKSITIGAPEEKQSVVHIGTTSKTVEVGDSFSVTATVVSILATEPAVTWASGDATVASVADGTVTALKKGNTTVTATVGTGDNAYTASCKVEITDVMVTSVTLDKTTVELKVGESVTLTATYAPANASEDTTFGWRSKRTSVATVENGVVTAKAVGTTEITVTCGAESAVCTVTVVKAEEQKPDDPEKPGDDPEKPSDDPEKPGDTETPKKEGGCGSAAGASALFASLALILASGIIVAVKNKKKANENK